MLHNKMGQYYKPMILGEKGVMEFVRLWLCAHSYGNGLKLTEHSYIGNKFVSAFEYLLSPKGMFYKSRVVWAGDYADNELYTDKNLYTLADEDETKLQRPDFHNTSSYIFIVNHTKKLYIEKKGSIHPLPLLTAEGNGRGGGDYRGTDAELCGTWARDVISVEVEKPNYYEELVCNFE
jgi:hypothetical protein